MGIGEHFEGVKQHWARNFAFLDYFKKVYGRDQTLPKWSDADVDEFIASDPVYGPQLKALRESRKFALGRALVGAAHLGGVVVKYSKSPHGVVLATVFGALTGAVLGSEVAEHWYQLYKMNKQGANLRFIYWWEDKVAAYGNAASEAMLQAISRDNILDNDMPLPLVFELPAVDEDASNHGDIFGQHSYRSS